MILEHNKKIYQTLLTLGLSDKQALIYLAALITGGGTITDLAKQAEIERTGVYNYLEDLIRRGLLRESTKGKRTVYLASDPTKLKELLKEKEHALEESLAKMQSMFSQNTGQSLVSYYQGKEGIINLYLEMEKIEEQMTSNECIYIFATTHGGFEFFPDFLTNLFERRAKMAVPTKSIHPLSEKPSRKELLSQDADVKTKNAWHIRDKKYIPDKYTKDQIGTIVIARDFVSMVDYKNAFGSITENKNLANTWRMFFQLIWDKY